MLSLCSSALRWRRIAALWLPLLPLLQPGHAHAAPINPPTLRQDAMAAGWASRAMMLSIARAGRNLVAVGERGFVLLSADGGRSWRQASAVPTSVTLTRVAFHDASVGWAVGHMGVVLRTVDGGDRWTIEADGIQSAGMALERARALGEPVQVANAEQLVADGPDKPLLSLLVQGPDRILALGAFGTGLRSDAGQRHAVFEDIPNPGMLHVYGLSERDGRVYAAGEQGLLLRSENGAPFKLLAAPYKGTLFGTRALANGAVLAYGLRGTVLRSADYGNTWATVTSGTKFAVTSSVILADGRVALGSQNGQIVVSDDAGLSFKDMATALQPVASLAQAPDGALVVAGPRGLARIDLAGGK